MDEQQVIELIANLGPGGMDAFNSYMKYLWITTLIQTVLIGSLLVGIGYIFSKLIDKMA